MHTRTLVRFSLVLALFCAVGGKNISHAQVVLVDDPYITSYQGWVDPVQDRGGDWRLNLHTGNTIMETSDIVVAGGDPSGSSNTGNYVPTLLIQDNYTSPDTYDLNARVYTTDDDLFGLVFGYQDPDNYFRVGMREQSSGSFGGTTGMAVQKVVGGVVTQLSPAAPGPGAASITQAMIEGRLPIDLNVAVDGTNYDISFNGSSLISGSDPDLMAGKIGIQSWAQRTDGGDALLWGTEVETISVEAGGVTEYSGTFDTGPVMWRPLYMANSNGLRIDDRASDDISGDEPGNFGLDINDPWIFQRDNGFTYATDDIAPNVDFLGPAVVVDEPGSEDFSNYRLQVRMGSTDDEGPGVLLRVQDDDNFYRVQFSASVRGAVVGQSRAPQGMSVQKVQNGVWTELFSEADGAALFLPVNSPDGTTPNDPTMEMFDLIVSAVGNTINVRVIDHNGNVFVYDPIVDDNNPLLTGTVGLTSWGNDHTYFMGYGGGSGPLLTAVPEPSTIALALLAGLGLFGWSRRRK